MKINTRTSSLIRLLLLTVSAVLFYIVVLSKTPLFLFSQYKTADTLFSYQPGFRPHHDYLKEIVVVEIDDESIYQLNRSWPWGREVFAVFLEKLRDLHPRVVGFDISFAGKSNSDAADRWFKDAVAENGNVILASHFDRNSVSFPYAYISPYEIFMRAAKAIGFINVPYDKDGVVRRTRVLLELADNRGYVYSFATQIACAYWGVSPEQTVQMKGRDIAFKIPLERGRKGFKEVLVPLDRKYHIPIAYRSLWSKIQRIPFWKVVAGQIDPKMMEGKIVLVGVTSLVVKDIHMTPLGLMPGVFINTYQTLMLLEQNFLKKCWPLHHWIFLVVLTVIFTLIFYRVPPQVGVAIFVITEILIYRFSLTLFLEKREIFSIFSTMFVLALVFMLGHLYKGLWAFFENRALQHRVVTDELTGVYSFRYLPMFLKSQFESHKRSGKEFCFAMFDVDHFKKVNDTYGHEQGNVVLVQMAKLLQKGTRAADVVGRYGGEEFWMTLTDCNTVMAHQVLERIRKSIEEQVFMDPKKNFYVTISIGICSNKENGVKEADDLIKFADAALYHAKESGRNQICIYSGSAVRAPA